MEEVKTIKQMNSQRNILKCAETVAQLLPDLPPSRVMNFHKERIREGALEKLVERLEEIEELTQDIYRDKNNEELRTAALITLATKIKLKLFLENNFGAGDAQKIYRKIMRKEPLERLEIIKICQGLEKYTQLKVFFMIENIPDYVIRRWSLRVGPSSQERHKNEHSLR